MTVESGTGSGTRATVVEDAKPAGAPKMFIDSALPQEAVPSAARQDAVQ